MNHIFSRAEATKVRGYWPGALWLAAGMLALTGQFARGDIVFDNTASPATHNHFKIGNGVEIGDEILLSVQAPVVITNFAFEYYGTSFSGDEQLRLRFYGPGATAAMLGDMLYDSGWVPVAPAPEGATVQFTDFIAGTAVPLTNTVPVDFTWSVQFQGLAAGEEAGLLTTVPRCCSTATLADAGTCDPTPCRPPEQDFTLYWQHFFDGWRRVRVLDDAQATIPVNFRARVEGEIAGIHFLRPMLREGESVLTLVGESGRRYRIEGSSDLAHWSEVKTGTAVDRVLSATAPASGGCRFYRAVLVE